LGNSPIPKCIKCEAETMHKSGVCKSCRVYTCKCGEKGIARSLGQVRCPKCKAASKAKHHFELCG